MKNIRHLFINLNHLLIKENIMSLHFLIRNYLKIIFRYIKRNKLFSTINIIGLAIGLSLSFFIALFIINELSYENIHKKRAQIARITMHIQNANYDIHWARLNVEWINRFPENYQEVEHLIRFQDYEPRNIQVGEDSYKVRNAFSVDAEVFKVFDFELIKGNSETALKGPHSVVLTESTAERFFGTSNVLNNELYIVNKTGTEKELYKVTGVMKDLPSNTHLPVNMLTSFSSEQDRKGWAYTYILMKEGVNIDGVQRKLSAFIEESIGSQEAANISMPLQSLSSIHLNSDLAREITTNGKISHVYLFGAVGIFILIMSAINFINLNIAQSLKRLREIGMRKILGSSKVNLIIYFLLEANVITMLATVLGLTIVIIGMPYFVNFTSISVSILVLLPITIIVSLVIGCLAGYYPAFILTKSNVLSAVKNKTGFNPRQKNFSVKNFLIAFQLVLCIILISSALITQSQFEYLVEKNLGFEKEQVLTITNIPQSVKYKYDFIKKELNHIPNINGVCSVMQVPTEAIRDTGPVFAEGKTEDLENPIVMDLQVVDHEFIDLMNIEVLAGRNFTPTEFKELDEDAKNDLFGYLQSQPREYIINETALKMIGWENSEEVIGKMFSWSIGDINLQRGEIVGIIKDFHQESLKARIDPVVLINEPVWINNILVKMDGKNLNQTMTSIEEIWHSNFPEYALEYTFLDDLYNSLYEREQKQLQLIYIFSSLAILIAFLGIFGIISYTLKTREKEIAVRKILGAELSSIFILLSKNFVLITLIGTFVTVPLTWIIMEKWLQNYVYRISINTSSFAIAILVILFVLMLTISFQLSKVTRNNPAKTLRAE